MIPGDRNFQHVSKFLNNESFATIDFSCGTTSSLLKSISSLVVGKGGGSDHENRLAERTSEGKVRQEST